MRTARSLLLAVMVAGLAVAAAAGTAAGRAVSSVDGVLSVSPGVTLTHTVAFSGVAGSTVVYTLTASRASDGGLEVFDRVDLAHLTAPVVTVYSPLHPDQVILTLKFGSTGHQSLTWHGTWGLHPMTISADLHSNGDVYVGAEDWFPMNHPLTMQITSPAQLGDESLPHVVWASAFATAGATGTPAYDRSFTFVAPIKPLVTSAAEIPDYAEYIAAQPVLRFGDGGPPLAGYDGWTWGLAVYATREQITFENGQLWYQSRDPRAADGLGPRVVVSGANMLGLYGVLTDQDPTQLGYHFSGTFVGPGNLYPVWIK